MPDETRMRTTLSEIQGWAYVCRHVCASQVVEQVDPCPQRESRERVVSPLHPSYSGTFCDGLSTLEVGLKLSSGAEQTWGG